MGTFDVLTYKVIKMFMVLLFDEVKIGDVIFFPQNLFHFMFLEFLSFQKCFRIASSARRHVRGEAIFERRQRLQVRGLCRGPHAAHHVWTLQVIN